jgi:hypothetical protein
VLGAAGWAAGEEAGETDDDEGAEEPPPLLLVEWPRRAMSHTAAKRPNTTSAT